MRLLRSRSAAARLLLALLGAGAFAGCAGTGTGDVPTGQYEVVASATPFFRFGPMQNQGPDIMLTRGQRVTILKREFGYCRVSSNGLLGYVPADDLKPIKPEPRLVTANKPRTPGGRARRSAPPPTDERVLDINDVPLPVADEPNRPRFRMR